MKGLVVFESKYGTTRKYAEALAKDLNFKFYSLEVELIMVN